MFINEEGVLSIPKLAEELGKEPVERTLPNGLKVKQIIWEGDDLKKIAQLMHNHSAELPEHVKIDGAAPAWLVAALAHEVHPRAVSVNSPDGYVPIGMMGPTEDGLGKDVIWEVAEGDDWHVVSVEQVDPSIPLNPKDLLEMAPPALPFGAKVILSGRMPNWLAVSTAMAYHGQTKAVALYQPGTGATVALTHSQEVEIGSVIPEEIVKAAVPRENYVSSYPERPTITRLRTDNYIITDELWDKGRGYLVLHRIIGSPREGRTDYVESRFYHNRQEKYAALMEMVQEVVELEESEKESENVSSSLQEQKVLKLKL